MRRNISGTILAMLLASMLMLIFNVQQAEAEIKIVDHEASAVDLAGNGFFFSDTKIYTGEYHYGSSAYQLPNPVVVKVGSRSYVGAMNQTGKNLYVIEYDDSVGNITKIVQLPYTAPVADLHFVPLIWRDSDGYFWAFSSRSLYPVKAMRSNNPDSIDVWTIKTNIIPEGSYRWPYQDPETKRIYVLIYDMSEKYHTVYYTDNNGDSWSKLATTIFPRPTEEYFLVPVLDTSNYRLHVAAAGTGRDFTRQQNVEYGYSDDWGVTWHAANGSSISNPEIVYKGWVTRVTVNLDYSTIPKQILILSTYGYKKTEWTSSDFEARFHYWNGSSWCNKLILNGDTFFVHGFNPSYGIVKDVNGRVHTFIQEQDSADYTGTSKFRLWYYYANSPYDTWAGLPISPWYGGRPCYPYLYPITQHTNKLPVGFIYADASKNPADQHVVMVSWMRPLVISNATISSYEELPSSITFCVLGTTDTSGYAEVILPIGLNSTNIKVFLNHTRMAFPLYDPPASISKNRTHYFIYMEFTFSSTYEISVQFPILGDITGAKFGIPDGEVDVRDIALAARGFGAVVGDPLWSDHTDISGATYLMPDNKIDIRDIALIAKHFGETYP